MFYYMTGQTVKTLSLPSICSLICPWIRSPTVTLVDSVGLVVEGAASLALRPEWEGAMDIGAADAGEGSCDHDFIVIIAGEGSSGGDWCVPKPPLLNEAVMTSKA